MHVAQPTAVISGLDWIGLVWLGLIFLGSLNVPNSKIGILGNPNPYDIPWITAVCIMDVGASVGNVRDCRSGVVGLLVYA